MNALDSPLEALAFNYLNYGLLTVVNNIWTWVAVLTAAVSFWRIRASSEHPRGKLLDGSSQTLLLPSPLVEKVAVDEHVDEVQEPEQMSWSSKTTPFCGLENEGVTKGKFTLYYYCNEEESEKCGTSTMDNGGNGEREEDGEGWWSKWEMVMKMRRGDDEWYRYQDMSLINGNVVRLWDGCRM